MRTLKEGWIMCDGQAMGGCSVGVAPEESDQSRRWYAPTQGPSAVLPPHSSYVKATEFSTLMTSGMGIGPILI